MCSSADASLSPSQATAHGSWSMWIATPRIGLAPTTHCRSPGALRKILDTTPWYPLSRCSHDKIAGADNGAACRRDLDLHRRLSREPGRHLGLDQCRRRCSLDLCSSFALGSVEGPPAGSSIHGSAVIAHRKTFEFVAFFGALHFLDNTSHFLEDHQSLLSIVDIWHNRRRYRKLDEEPSSARRMKLPRNQRRANEHDLTADNQSCETATAFPSARLYTPVCSS